MMYDWGTGAARALTMPADMTTMPKMYRTSTRLFLTVVETPLRSDDLPKPLLYSRDARL